MVQECRGSYDGAGFRFAIVAAQFNEPVSAGLLNGARAALAEACVREEDLTIVYVPGAFEIPLAALRLAETGRYAAVICLGCVVKGETAHFEHISSAMSMGIMDVAVATGVPGTFGVLTTLTEAQAVARAAEGPWNKGREAARAAVRMATLMTQIEGGDDEAPA